ncbi:HEAT repeat domain-containing protein [Roseiconus nitratireducens]|uniref:HEAT repeat domain-containing protein n=1 Tax=Roseiconus nitratireducens TaxID=2605748 RepID=A0A5M6D9I1_9BACT|nr:HEAT repeat domain-containing protein [Roseiconus nitratireducens]KAA5541855.1 HEAT repeat domain-containing protein [Roseiconus nitratireducens]
MATDTSGMIDAKGLLRPRMLAWLAGWLLLVGPAVGPVAGQSILDEYELPMFDRPELPFSKIQSVFQPGLKELWLRALQRPDAQLQRTVIDTIAMAHRKGLPGLEETIPRLVELAKQPNQNRDVQRSIAQTLVTLDARQHASLLQGLSVRHGLSLAEIVEPALASWEFGEMETVWVQRLQDRDVSDQMLRLAVSGLGALKSERGTEALKQVIRSRHSSNSLRVAAARSLGQIHDTSLTELAETLTSTPSTPPELNSLMAIELLSNHEDAQAIDLLSGMIDADSTAIQSRALERLYAIDPELVNQRAVQLIASDDVNVRRLAARAMLASETVARVRPLARLLDDVNPSLRREVASGLIDLAKQEDLRGEILDATMEVLNDDRWRGCEQACVVLTHLDHKPGGPRMVQLLAHPRGEVQVASAWGLTRLRVEALLPDMLDHAKSVYAGFQSGEITSSQPGATYHLAHLFNAFGDQQFEPSEDLLKKFIPKQFDLGIMPRAAAAWALGMIHEGDPDQPLVDLFVERLSDVQGDFPEIEAVRSMSAVSLGRMEAKSALPVLRQFAGTNIACRWAIEQLTGEEPPPIQDVIQNVGGWILAPLEDRPGS